MKKILAIGTIIAALSGCSEEPSEEFERIVISTLLSNTWRAECVIDGENSYLPTLVFVTDGVTLFNSGTGTSSNIYHTANTTCTSIDPEVLDLSTFSYTLGADVIVDGSIEGITAAVEIDTVDTTEGSVDLGVEVFNIFAIKDRFTLYFGNKDEPTNGSTADLRPTQLSDSFIFTR